MLVLQQADAQNEELLGNTSFEAEDCLGLLDLTPEYMATYGRNTFRDL
jgi:hypothetical protein